MFYTIQASPKTSYIRKPLRFGQGGKPDQGNIQHTPQNGVWITTERYPAKMGGLGEVSKTIPEAFAQYLPKKDLRIIVPYLGKHRDDDEQKKAALKKGDPKVHEGDIFQNTGTQLTFETEDGRKARLEVLQKFEDATGFEEHNQSQKEGQKVGNWVYALRNDDYFMGKNEFGVEAEKGLLDYTYNPEAGEFDKVMLFNKGASELLPLLNGNNRDPRATGLSRFNNQHKPEQFPKKDNIQPPSNEDFRKNIDFVIAHDWLTGTVNNELPDLPYTRKHFVVHNMFDKEQAPHVAERTGLLSPPRLFNQERTFSALNAGIEPSDSIWVNNNFKKTVLESTLPNGAPFISILRQKSEAGRTHNLHHGLSADYTASGPLAPKCLEENYLGAKKDEGWLPKAQKNRDDMSQKLAELQKKAKQLKAENKILDENKALELKLLNKNIKKAKVDLNKVNIQIKAAEDGHNAGDGNPYQFQKLAVDEGKTLPTPEQMRQFKAANKAALQKKLGLKQDPDAVIISWAARLDPRQKNVYLFMKSVSNLLEKNPKVQFVVVGDTTDPKIIEWIEEVNQKYNTKPGEGRVYIPNVFANQDEVKQINAGSDFTALPSLYEPYGLTQLEAMKMGSIPIVHGVDGLRSTVSDPEINKKLKAITPKNEWEPVWEKKQNGILMEPVDIDKYKEYIDNRQEFESLQALKAKLDKNKRPTPSADTILEAKKQAKAFKSLLKKLDGLVDINEYKEHIDNRQDFEALHALKDLANIDEYKEYIDNDQAFKALQALKLKLDKSKLVITKNDPKIEAEWKQKEADAFKALLGKLEGLANTFEYKLKSFQLQSKELKETAKSGTLSPERKRELNTKIEWLDRQTEEESPLHKHAKEARAAYKALAKKPDELETHYAKVLAMVKPEERINNDAADKLTQALERGIKLLGDTKKSLQTRIDAIDYVNTEHDWKNILQKYYQPALENDATDHDIRKRHTRELSESQKALRPKITTDKEYTQTRPGSSSKPTGFNGAIQHYWNLLWNLNQQFWSAIGRVFSFRKD
jgi:glycogen synthase